jgi:hypothetical protein
MQVSSAGASYENLRKSRLSLSLSSSFLRKPGFDNGGAFSHDLLWMHRAVPSLRSIARTVHTTSRVFALNGAGTSTVNASEINHFSRLSSLWWDEQGEFALLHKMNPVRMQFIRRKLVEIARDDGEWPDIDEDRSPLEGLNVLDVGCGGGLLSEVSLQNVNASVLITYCPDRVLQGLVPKHSGSMPQSPMSRSPPCMLPLIPNCLFHLRTAQQMAPS